MLPAHQIEVGVRSVSPSLDRDPEEPEDRTVEDHPADNVRAEHAVPAVQLDAQLEADMNLHMGVELDMQSNVQGEEAVHGLQNNSNAADLRS